MKKLILLLVVLFSCTTEKTPLEPIEDPKTDLLNLRVFLAKGSHEGFFWLYYDDSLYVFERINYNDTLEVNIPKLNYTQCEGTSNTNRDCVIWYDILAYPIDYDSSQIGIFIR